MINFNGSIIAETNIQVENNRAFLFGDAVFETVRITGDKVLFAEDHYFRLMASMRILRMEIPMDFTPEYFEAQLMLLIAALPPAVSFRARVTVYRKNGGYYLPKDNGVAFIITAEPLDQPLYSVGQEPYEVDLFKDYYVSKQLLSTLKTTNRAINITGSIFAEENGLQNCLLMNDEKNVVEALQGNIFMLNGTHLVTPPVSDGCLNGIMRKQVLAIARKIEGVTVAEASISPFELQKADELFITNVVKGIQPITRYRKKDYTNSFASEVVKRLNAQVRLG